MRWVFRLINWIHPLLYRLRHGSGWVSRMYGQPVMLLTYTGRRTRRRRTIGLVYYLEDGDPIVAATAGGQPNDPQWTYSLRSVPEAVAQVGSDRFSVRAESLSGAERDRMWRKACELFLRFADYEDKAHRTIPVLRLHRPLVGIDGKDCSVSPLAPSFQRMESPSIPGQLTRGFWCACSCGSCGRIWTPTFYATLLTLRAVRSKDIALGCRGPRPNSDLG